MSVEDCGEIIDKIDVTISYRIIELFSAGLYSSPNKAFEELVCNSYDAFADNVAVSISPDLTVAGAHIWVCDNGESMDQQGLKDLWRIGVSKKRKDGSRDEQRLQIGRFGIGKMATYVLANKLTYVCRKNGRYLATTMDYTDIREEKENESLVLDERELTKDEANAVLSPYLIDSGKSLLPFKLFGKDAAENWTFTILTELKPKASEIKQGRLKWILRTALPLNPGFSLYYNGTLLESSKISRPIRKTWVLGHDDPAAEALDFATPQSVKDKCHIDFDNLNGVNGQIDLYEDSLVDSSKSSEQGRSHGIFLMVRGRLINLDDPLLGMEAFSHGAFNRTRIIINADGLDSNLASTRESVKESIPLNQLKAYLKRKFNSEVKKYHFEQENEEHKKRSISHRLAQTSLTLSKRPLYIFAEKYFNNEILNPILIEKPPSDMKVELLRELKNELSEGESIIKKIDWSILTSSEPIAKLDLQSGTLKINLLHPYIANYNDAYKSTLPLEFMAITEVLTEAHLYELGVDESIINTIIRRRDNTLRELSLSDREGAPAVAQMLNDSTSDETGLEEAVYRAFSTLGFEVKKIGGNGKPDGHAEAMLGYTHGGENSNYSLTYDAKSTAKTKIKAGTAKISGIKRHQDDYNADFSVVVAVDYEGSDNSDSAINKETKQQTVTAIKVADLVRLLLLSGPKQVGLVRIKDMFQTCCTPAEVSTWIDGIQQEKLVIGPVKELIETIYELQSQDTEPPEIASVRIKLNEKINSNISNNGVRKLIESLKVFVPGFVSVEDNKIGIQGHPDKVFDVIKGAINQVPNDLQKIYLDAYSIKSSPIK